MAIPRRIIPSLIPKPTQVPSRLCVLNLYSALAESVIQSDSKNRSDEIANSICNSFRRGWDWNTLQQKFDLLVLNDSTVREVLLRLKEPADARCALGFFHWSAKVKSFEHGIHSYCIVIHILVGAQLIRDAKVLIESVLRKSAEGSDSKLLIVDSLLSSYQICSSRTLVFDLLVQGYAKLRMPEIGFEVSCYLEARGFRLSVTSYNSLLHVTQRSDQSNGLIWRIYEHMIRLRIYPNEASIRILISALCKEGQLQRSVDFLDRVHGKRCAPITIVNATLVYRVLDEGRIEDGMALLKRLLQRNMLFDTVAYSLTIYAKLKSGDVDSAWEIYQEMTRRGFDANSFVYTAFIGAYCREGRVGESDRLVREMEDTGLNPYDETYNLLIEGLARGGRVDESLQYCWKMVEKGLVPTRPAFNKLVERLSEIGDVKKANEIFTVLLEKGFLPDGVTYSLLVSGYGRIGEGEEVLKLYYEMEYKGLARGTVALGPLIGSLCRCGKIGEAEKYLRTMDCYSEPEYVNLCKVLIRSYLERGDRTGALKFCNEMVSKDEAQKERKYSNSVNLFRVGVKSSSKIMSWIQQLLMIGKDFHSKQMLRGHLENFFRPKVEETRVVSLDGETRDCSRVELKTCKWIKLETGWKTLPENQNTRLSSITPNTEQYLQTMEE